MSSSAVNYMPRYTVDDYEQWEGDWELWNGVAVCMSPAPSPLHQYVASALAGEIREQLRKNSRCDCLVVPEVDWRIDRNTVVRPDVLVICNGLPDKYLNYPPAFIAEILSPSTAHKDRTAKKNLYEQHGVKWYLIVDADAKTIDVFELQNGVYAEHSVLEGKVTLSFDEECSALVKFDRILDR